MLFTKSNFNPQLWAGVGIDIETVVDRIIANGRDITVGYDNWLRLGFALADGRGEAGREMYHRLSAMNPQYNEAECNHQYDACLKSADRPGGVTVATLFQMAKDAGVNVSARMVEQVEVAEQVEMVEVAELVEQVETVEMDTFLDKVSHDDLPPIVQRLVESCDNLQEADMMTLGMIVAASGAMPGICGVYDRRRVYSPLYSCIVAPPASSKGRLAACMKFVEPIQTEIREANLREMADYKAQMAEYQALGRKANPADQPQEPPFRSLFVPANSSSTATYQALNDNGGEGLTFETEGDVMATTMRSDYGDYSTGLRAAFHHEPIVYNRRKDNEHVDIQEPRWAVMLTGTPHQVVNLVPDAENGLFSRFIFYKIDRRVEWHDVFRDDEIIIDDVIRELGEKYLPIYHLMKSRKACPVKFRLTPAQKRRFNAFFMELQTEQANQIGDDMVASVRRLGLVCFRIAMILTVLRSVGSDSVEWGSVERVECDDRDFTTALELVNVLVAHTAMVYATLLRHDEPQQDIRMSGMNDVQRSVFDAMGDEFTTKDVIEYTSSRNIPRRTAENIIGSFLTRFRVATRVKNGLYRKTSIAV